MHYAVLLTVLIAQSVVDRFCSVVMLTPGPGSVLLSST